MIGPRRVLTLPVAQNTVSRRPVHIESQRAQYGSSASVMRGGIANWKDVEPMGIGVYHFLYVTEYYQLVAESPLRTLLPKSDAITESY